MKSFTDSYQAPISASYTHRIMVIARSITLLLCLCALALRVGGMHVHVAVDHSEAPHQAHFAAFDLHQAGHDASDAGVTGDHHEHIEVSLDGEALSKKPGSDLGSDALLFIATLLFLLLAPRKLMRPLNRLRAPPLQRFAHLRPPLRGPPLHA